MGPPPAHPSVFAGISSDKFISARAAELTWCSPGTHEACKGLKAKGRRGIRK